MRSSDPLGRASSLGLREPPPRPEIPPPPLHGDSVSAMDQRNGPLLRVRGGSWPPLGSMAMVEANLSHLDGNLCQKQTRGRRRALAASCFAALLSTCVQLQPVSSHSQRLRRFRFFPTIKHAIFEMRNQYCIQYLALLKLQI